MPRGKHTFLTKQMVKKTPEEEEKDWLTRYGVETSPSKPTGGKQKTKYRNVVEVEKDQAVIKLPGRVKCECQARKHALVNNCLECGRVVCEQEGSGPCFYCQSLVATSEEEEILRAGTKRSRELRRALLGGVVESEEGPRRAESGGKVSLSNIGDSLYQKAAQDKDRLLGFDKDTVRRTKVIDDQSDYFTTDRTWSTKEERERANKQREAVLKARLQPRSQRPQKISLDFMGRQVLEQDPIAEAEASIAAELGRREEEDLALRFALEASLEDAVPYLPPSGGLRDNIAAPDIAPGMRPIYEGSGERREGGPSVPDFHRRIQDSGGLGQADQGLCLSMHQPYASLLVRGIKKHEGRTWMSSHRGRLWIHAGGKQIGREERQRVEDFYREFYADGLPAPFPHDYPSGCVIGCVNVTDVLPKEQYDDMYPEGESEAPYVMICEDPRELGVALPMPGAPKVFPLPTHIRSAVRQMLTQGLVN